MPNTLSRLVNASIIEMRSQLVNINTIHKMYEFMMQHGEIEPIWSWIRTYLIKYINAQYELALSNNSEIINSFPGIKNLPNYGKRIKFETGDIVDNVMIMSAYNILFSDVMETVLKFTSKDVVISKAFISKDTYHFIELISHKGFGDNWLSRITGALTKVRKDIDVSLSSSRQLCFIKY